MHTAELVAFSLLYFSTVNARWYMRLKKAMEKYEAELLAAKLEMQELTMKIIGEEIHDNGTEAHTGIIIHTTVWAITAHVSSNKTWAWKYKRYHQWVAQWSESYQRSLPIRQISNDPGAQMSRAAMYKKSQAEYLPCFWSGKWRDYMVPSGIACGAENCANFSKQSQTFGLHKFVCRDKW